MAKVQVDLNDEQDDKVNFLAKEFGKSKEKTIKIIIDQVQIKEAVYKNG